MDELVRWLGEQLDEDERIARAADPELSNVFSRIETFDPEMAADERHIMLHAPARVLREIAVKRARLKLYQNALDRWSTLPRTERSTIAGESLRIKVTTLEVVVQGDAQSYAGRPGFIDHWLM